MDIIRSLEQLKVMLPGDTPNKENGECCYETFNLFAYDGEPELALNSLVYIAEAHADNGTSVNDAFWVQAKEIATYLEHINHSTTYSDIMRDCFQTIARHL